jgi:hypothetical protein
LIYGWLRALFFLSIFNILRAPGFSPFFRCCLVLFLFSFSFLYPDEIFENFDVKHRTNERERDESLRAGMLTVVPFPSFLRLVSFSKMVEINPTTPPETKTKNKKTKHFDCFGSACPSRQTDKKQRKRLASRSNCENTPENERA